MMTVNRVAMEKGNLPRFVTCAFPDDVPEPEEIPRIWDNFVRALEKFCPNLGLIWKKELMTRKSGKICKGRSVPHYHALVWGLEDEVELRARRGNWVQIRKTSKGWNWIVFALDENGMRIERINYALPFDVLIPTKLLLSLLWYEAVGSGDRRNYDAGTNVSSVKSLNGVRHYVGKYMGKDCLASSRWASGRWWGMRQNTYSLG